VLERLNLPTKARVIRETQMRSSSKEIPDPLEHWENPANLSLKPHGWWLSERATFDGQASTLNTYQELSAPADVTVSGATAAFCITKDGRFLGIISPNQPTQASVWIGTACSRVQASPESSQKNSPLSLQGDGWIVRLGDVSRVYRSLRTQGRSAAKTGATVAAFALADVLILPGGGKRSAEVEGRYETNQTRSFIEAIATAAAPSATDTFVKPDGPPLGEGYRWVQDAGLGGIYRLERKGEPTTATFLVDRELPKSEQMAALDKLDWAPRDMVEWVIRRVDDDALPVLYRPELPAGRVSQPFLLNSLGLNVGDEPTGHPVTRHLWPSLDHGELALDPSEQLLHEYRCDRAKLSSPSSAEQAYSSAEIGTSKTANARVFVTNQRVAVVASRLPEGIFAGDTRRWWVSHFRHEWIYEVGTHDSVSVQKTLFRARPKPGTEKRALAPFIRMHQARGLHELLFSELADSTFVSSVVDAITAANDARTVSDGQARHEAGNFQVMRTVKRISDPTPYSLPLGLASRT
jgi:hypothetical protein